MMALDYASKATPLADADDVDKLFTFEDIDQHAISNLHGAVGLGFLFDL